MFIEVNNNLPQTAAEQVNLESLLTTDYAANYKLNTKRRIGVSHARIKNTLVES